MRDAHVKGACSFSDTVYDLVDDIKIEIKHNHMHVQPCTKQPQIPPYAADHSSRSVGCVRMAALEKFFRMSGSWVGMLICWAQNIVSGRGMAAT